MAPSSPSSAPAKSRQPSWRRWLQFRIRTLLALIVVCAFVLGFYAQIGRRARQHDEAVQMVLECAGSLNFVEDDTNDSWSDRLRTWYGQESRPVEALNLEDMSDEQLPFIGRLIGLKKLRLSGYGISDAGMKSLAGLSHLEELRLLHTTVGDSGVSSLAKLDNLRVLNLRGADVTDAGLEHLARLSKLESLILDQTMITQRGIDRLRVSLPQCRISNTLTLPRPDVAQGDP